MVKYIIEGNIDFYKELYESLDDNDNDDAEIPKTNNLCLITNAPLEKDHIQLFCNHSFNYIPLYNDLCKQKKNGTESYHKKNLIKCPYCRSLHEYILPFNPNVTPVYGVNTLNSIYMNVVKSAYNNNNKNTPIGYTEGVCEYKTTSHHDQSQNVTCNEIYVKKIENNKCYCMHHKYLGLQLYWTQLKDEYIKKKEEQKKKIQEDKLIIKAQKEELREKKKKEKEDIKKQQQKEKTEKKEKEKQEKQEQEQQKKEKQQEEKKVTTNTCVQVLKSGIRKGQECGCKTQNINKLCNRHIEKNGDTVEIDK
jgi:hypothetical protein